MSCATGLALQLRTPAAPAKRVPGGFGDIACFFRHIMQKENIGTLLSYRKYMKILKLNTPKRYPGGVNFGVPY